MHFSTRAVHKNKRTCTYKSARPRSVNEKKKNATRACAQNKASLSLSISLTLQRDSPKLIHLRGSLTEQSIERRVRSRSHVADAAFSESRARVRGRQIFRSVRASVFLASEGLLNAKTRVTSASLVSARARSLRGGCCKSSMYIGNNVTWSMLIPFLRPIIMLFCSASCPRLKRAATRIIYSLRCRCLHAGARARISFNWLKILSRRLLRGTCVRGNK